MNDRKDIKVCLKIKGKWLNESSSKTHRLSVQRYQCLLTKS